MAAHSEGFRPIPPVAFDQPPTGWPQWLREMAQSINLVSSWVGTVTAPGEGGEGGGSTVTVSDTAPAGTQGSLWFDSVNCQLYTWYDDPSGDPGQWVIANSGIPGVSGGGGTTILSGSGPPADSLGEVGDYYIDETGNSMYGPKSSGLSYGPGQSAIPAAASPTPGYSHPTIEYGGYVKFAAAGQVSAVKYWRDSTTTQLARTVNIWHPTTEALLATETVANDGGGSGWKTINLTTPLTVAFDEIVVVTVGSTHNYSRSDGVTYPISDGGLVSLTQGVYGLTLNTFPTAPNTSINFFVDVVFRQAISNVWPIAINGDAGGGSGGGIEEAPLDGTAYGRRNTAWVDVLMATGDIVDGGNY